MKRTFLKCSLISLLFIIIIISSSVYSTWCYANDNVANTTGLVGVTLQVFEYAPEEVLPEYDDGKNHVELVNNLVEGENGLNNPNSYLNAQIKNRQNGGLFKPKRDTLGSMGVDQGDELEKLFSLASQNLSFLIQFIDDSTYYIFTTEVDLGENGKPNYKIGEEYIAPIYRTIVEKINGVWTSQTSAKGYALSAYYEESNIFVNVTKIPSFAPNTWTIGVP